jgi:phosphonoacetaldehyde hydrolase
MRQARVCPPEAVVKVGDTRPDIAAGLNAGVWSIGVAKTGNEVGLNEKELNALPADVMTRKLAVARDTLAKEGAHYVLDTIADLRVALDDIERRLRAGERP